MKKSYIIIVSLVLLSLIFLYVGVTIAMKNSVTKSQTEVYQEVKAIETQPLTPDGLLKLVNEERAKVGVAPLQIDERLNQSAQYKADDMVARNYFSHNDPATGRKNGLDKADELVRGNTTCTAVSENIFDNKIDDMNTADRAVTGWVTSPKHYRAMINPNYILTGFGISGTKIVEHFCQQ